MRRIMVMALWGAGCAADPGGAEAWMGTVTGSSGGDEVPETTSAGSTTTDAPPPGTDPGGTTTTGAGDSSEGSGDDPASSTGLMCLAPTEPCEAAEACCTGYDCGQTSLGQVCCGHEGASCSTANGEDCCDNLECIDGVCGYAISPACAPACTEAPTLVVEKQRLAAIGGSFLGICGDANHTYGYHVPAANLPGSDYSLQGAANEPVCQYHGCAIDIGMDWPASREWLQWLIVQIQTDAITGIAEVIGSYDGVNVRYWSDSSGWSVEGVPYTGSGHDTWTHVSIYRSTALEDHGILRGWGPQGEF